MTTSPTRMVVVGYDGSPASDAAATWAAQEADRRHAPLRLVHALALPIVRSPMGLAVMLRIDPIRAAAERLLDDTCRRIRAKHPDLAIDVAVTVADAAPTLLHEATDAGLLVLGSRGLGEFRNLASGSVTTHVATHAPCPVVVVPAHWEPGRTKPAEVVVGVDGSETSIAAVDFAFEQAQATGATLTAVLAWRDPVWTGPGEQVPLVYDLDELEQENAAVLAESLAGHTEKYPDVTVNRKLVRGHTAEVLVEAARSAQLLVVGSRGRGAFRGMLLGSVSRSMLHHSPCPVAVIR
ncbi:MAG TPA: universal stress protein [Kribbella sp.]|nr:universal stress protein [Kribbella sp.]